MNMILKTLVNQRRETAVAHKCHKV